MTNPTMGDPAYDAYVESKMKGLEPYLRLRMLIELVRRYKEAGEDVREAEREYFVAVLHGFNGELLQPRATRLARELMRRANLKIQMRFAAHDLLASTMDIYVKPSIPTRDELRNKKRRRREAFRSGAATFKAYAFSNRPRRRDRLKYISFGDDTRVRKPAADQPPAEREE